MELEGAACCALANATSWAGISHCVSSGVCTASVLCSLFIWSAWGRCSCRWLGIRCLWGSLKSVIIIPCSVGDTLHLGKVSIVRIQVPVDCSWSKSYYANSSAGYLLQCKNMSYNVQLLLPSGWGGFWLGYSGFSSSSTFLFARKSSSMLWSFGMCLREHPGLKNSFQQYPVVLKGSHISSKGRLSTY